MKKILVLMVVAVAVGAAWKHYDLGEYFDPESIRLVDREPAALNLDDLEGFRHTLAEYRGHVVVVDVWATWCSTCVQELQHIQQLKTSNAPKGVKFLGLNVDGTAGDPGAGMERMDLRSFASQHGLDFPVMIADEATWQEWGKNPKGESYAIPITYVIDQKGRVRFEECVANPEDVQMVIDKLLAQSAR